MQRRRRDEEPDRRSQRRGEQESCRPLIGDKLPNNPHHQSAAPPNNTGVRSVVKSERPRELINCNVGLGGVPERCVFSITHVPFSPSPHGGISAARPPPARGE